jgi:hypothetical protein
LITNTLAPLLAPYRCRNAVNVGEMDFLVYQSGRCLIESSHPMCPDEGRDIAIPT